VHTGSLYTVAAIPRGQRFSGALSCHADIAGVVEDALRPKTILYVGGSRTRGFGEVEVTEMRVADKPTPIRKRAQKLRDSLGDDLFTVDLVSPVILRDRFWRPVQDIAPGRLQEWAGADAFSFEGAWKSMTEIRGWNAAWGLPKTPDMAIERGSVFAFRLPSLDGVDWDALERIENGRVGERRSEGFGEIRFCHEWHTLSAEGSHG
jgi:CRISPR-associated protein Csx10